MKDLDLGDAAEERVGVNCLQNNTSINSSVNNQSDYLRQEMRDERVERQNTSSK